MVRLDIPDHALMQEVRREGGEEGFWGEGRKPYGWEDAEGS